MAVLKLKALYSGGTFIDLRYGLSDFGDRFHCAVMNVLIYCRFQATFSLMSKVAATCHSGYSHL